MSIKPNLVMPRLKKSAVRPSQEDFVLLSALCRWRYATVPQIQRLVSPGITSQAVYKRLRRLQDCGLVTARLHGIPRGMFCLYIPTPAAYDWVMSDLHSEQAVSLASLEHTLGVCDVSAFYRDYQSNGRIWTEREIASAVYQWRRVRDAKKPGKPAMPGPPARPVVEQPDGPFLVDHRYGRTHAPDLVIEDEDGQWHGCEVELTAKSPARLIAIWSMFAKDPRFASVTYWAPRAVAAKIEALYAEQVHALPGLNLQVYRYEPLHSTPVQVQRKVNQGQQAA